MVEVVPSVNPGNIILNDYIDVNFDWCVSRFLFGFIDGYACVCRLSCCFILAVTEDLCWTGKTALTRRVLSSLSPSTNKNTIIITVTKHLKSIVFLPRAPIPDCPSEARAEYNFVALLTLKGKTSGSKTDEVSKMFLGEGGHLIADFPPYWGFI